METPSNLLVKRKTLSPKRSSMLYWRTLLEIHRGKPFFSNANLHHETSVDENNAKLNHVERSGSAYVVK